jgi:hypothetical protein
MRTETKFPSSVFRFPSSKGGIFLWHSPHGHPHWALPSKSGLSEARTFLRQSLQPSVFLFPWVPILLESGNCGGGFRVTVD